MGVVTFWILPFLGIYSGVSRLCFTWLYDIKYHFVCCFFSFVCERSSHFFYPFLKTSYSSWFFFWSNDFQVCSPVLRVLQMLWFAICSWIVISLGRGFKFGGSFLSEFGWVVLVNILYIMHFVTVGSHIGHQTVWGWDAREVGCSQCLAPLDPPGLHFGQVGAFQIEGMRTETTLTEMRSPGSFH